MFIRYSIGSNGDWFCVILGFYEFKCDVEKVKYSLCKVNIVIC